MTSKPRKRLTRQQRLKKKAIRIAELEKTNAELRRFNLALAERVAKQSELLSRKAEKQ